MCACFWHNLSQVKHRSVSHLCALPTCEKGQGLACVRPCPLMGCPSKLARATGPKNTRLLWTHIRLQIRIPPIFNLRPSRRSCPSLSWHRCVRLYIRMRVDGILGEGLSSTKICQYLFGKNSLAWHAMADPFIFCPCSVYCHVHLFFLGSPPHFSFHIGTTCRDPRDIPWTKLPSWAQVLFRHSGLPSGGRGEGEGRTGEERGTQIGLRTFDKVYVNLSAKVGSNPTPWPCRKSTSILLMVTQFSPSTPLITIPTHFSHCHPTIL